MRSRADSLSPFARRVLSLVGRIPPGQVVTYGDLARIAGRPRAARAVGTIMRRARVPGLPYHRVIAAGGRVGGYGGAPGMKAALLGAEGVAIHRLRVVDFDRHRWTGRDARVARSRTRAKPAT
jgi:methylated-DNA-[protein]-cysteine S-methyltransferase